MRKTLISSRLMAGPDRVLSVLHVYAQLEEQAKFAVLELAWKQNAQRVSCVPAGHYTITPEGPTEHFPYPHFRITSPITNRSGVLLHIGNFPKNTEGCLLVGSRFADLDADGLFDVSQSTTAMHLLSQLVTEEADLWIFDATGGHNG